MGVAGEGDCRTLVACTEAATGSEWIGSSGCLGSSGMPQAGKKCHRPSDGAGRKGWEGSFEVSTVGASSVWGWGGSHSVSAIVCSLEPRAVAPDP